MEISRGRVSNAMSVLQRLEQLGFHIERLAFRHKNGVDICDVSVDDLRRLVEGWVCGGPRY